MLRGKAKILDRLFFFFFNGFTTCSVESCLPLSELVYLFFGFFGGGRADLSVARSSYWKGCCSFERGGIVEVIRALAHGDVAGMGVRCRAKEKEG